MLKKKGEEIALRPKSFFEEYNIEVLLKKEVHTKNYTFNSTTIVLHLQKCPLDSHFFTDFKRQSS